MSIDLCRLSCGLANLPKQQEKEAEDTVSRKAANNILNRLQRTVVGLNETNTKSQLCHILDVDPCKASGRGKTNRKSLRALLNRSIREAETIPNKIIREETLGLLRNCRNLL